MQTATSFRTERRRRGWTLRDLAAECAKAGRPVDFGHLGRIERAEVVPNPALAKLLAELLALDITYFDEAAS